MQKEDIENIFFNKIKQEVKVLSNIHYIIDKIDKDGFLKIIKQCFNSILNNEIVFAIKELEKREKKYKNFDLKNQLTNNTYIFKENLKQIANLMVDQIWKEKMKGPKINSTIEKAKKKIQIGTFDEIKEEDEQLSSSNEESLSLEPKKNDNFSDEPNKDEIEDSYQNEKNMEKPENYEDDGEEDEDEDEEDENYGAYKNNKNYLINYEIGDYDTIEKDEDNFYFDKGVNKSKKNIKLSSSTKVIKSEISRSLTESELNVQNKYHKTDGNEKIRKNSSKNSLKDKAKTKIKKELNISDDLIKKIYKNNG